MQASKILPRSFIRVRRREANVRGIDGSWTFLEVMVSSTLSTRGVPRCLARRRLHGRNGCQYPDDLAMAQACASGAPRSGLNQCFSASTILA